MLILQDVTYKHPDQDVLFSGLDLSVNPHDKIALVGNNGTGKSTLLRLIAGELPVFAGSIRRNVISYYIPQLFGQYDHFTIAEALRIDKKLLALKQILNGDVSEQNMNMLNDDWTIEERCHEALDHWRLEVQDLFTPMAALSGGQKTKAFLAGIDIHQPEFVLLDEPGNHLDADSRAILYDYIQHTDDTLLVVSHDRTLLNLLTTVFELDQGKIHVYGGNYEFYREQKLVTTQALQQDVQSKEKALRKARQTEREAAERQQKLDARGKKKQEKAGLPTISMNTFRNNAEKSTARVKGVHEEKVDGIYRELESLRKDLPGADKMKMIFDDSTLHKGKRLIIANDVDHKYNDQWLWKEPLSFQISSGERIAIKGANGSGKTTLIRLMLGDLRPTKGTMVNAASQTIYIDQEYSIISTGLSLYEQAQRFNTANLPEHAVKNRLTKFLFTKGDWDKSSSILSGGERMRLLLCCLTLTPVPPDIIVLDEPTNNLDIQNVEILTNAINEYKGTLIVVSHDANFLAQTGITRFMEL
ncbi:MAG: ABC transporter ATP-binding protein [Citrobacter freundii]|nr:MAG: ABC transporter ATP-binding protein [Citrobacter freundii]